MNWDAIGAGAELLGALGVIISLVYLALQIRQNSTLLRHTTDMARVQAAIVSANHGADSMRMIALDAEAARIWSQGLRDPGALPPEELSRFDMLMASQIIQIDVNHFLAVSGTLDPAVGAIWDNILETWLHHPRFVEFEKSGALSRVTTRYFAEHVQAKRKAAQVSTNEHARA